MGKMTKLVELTETYLKKLKEEMIRNGYYGSFFFEYKPIEEKDGYLSSSYLLPQNSLEVPQSDK